MTNLILIPFGAAYLQLTSEEYAAILGRGLAPGPNAAPAVAPVGAAPLLDSRQLSALLGVGDVLIETMARDGRLPAVRIGKALRFDPTEVLRILKCGHAESAPLYPQRNKQRVLGRGQACGSKAREI